MLSALGRLSRADHVPAAAAPALLPSVENARIQRHPVGPLLTGAWDRRGDLRLVDALSVDTSKAGPRAALLVITPAGYAHTRPDGVTVAPIGALCP